MSKLHHPNIVRLLGYHTSERPSDPQCLVYELADGGTLAELLQSREGRKLFSWRDRVRTALCVASALAYMHSKKCYHLDIKPRNICFSSDMERVLVIDFGTAIFFQDQPPENNGSCVFSPDYSAPEFRSSTVGPKSDVFSLGVVMQVLVCGELPASPDNNDEGIFQPDQHVLRSFAPDMFAEEEWDAKVLKEFVDMAKRCTSPQSRNRPVISQVHSKLIDLNHRSQRELNTEELRVVAEVREASRTVDGDTQTKLASRSTCSCSRSGVDGVKCPLHGDDHFCCNECFRVHVTQNLGEEHIYCREEGCVGGGTPYTYDQIYQHAGPVLFHRHIELQRRNADERHKAEIYQAKLETLQKNAKKSDLDAATSRVMRGLESIGNDELKCPRLCLLVLNKGTRGKQSMRRMKTRVRSIWSQTIHIYFVCACSKLPVWPPVKVQKKREWMKKVVPAVKATIVVMNLALAASMTHLQIPLEGGNAKDQLRCMDELVDKFLSPEEAKTIEEDMTRAFEGDSESPSLEATTLTHAAYLEIEKVANEDGRWRNSMRLSRNKSGELAWVHRNHVKKWSETESSGTE